MEQRGTNKTETKHELRLAGENRQPQQNRSRRSWEIDVEDNTYVMTSLKGNNAWKEEAKRNAGQGILMTVGQIVVYLTAIAMIAMFVMLAKEGTANLYVNLLKWKYALIAGVSLFILDAVVVNILQVKNLSLVLIAGIFPFLYPMKRNKEVNGDSGFGLVCTIGYVIAFLVTFSVFVQGYVNYGNVIKIEEDTIRSAVVELLDQKWDDERLGRKIMKNMSIKTVKVEQKGKGKVILLSGTGRVYLDGGSFLQQEEESIETSLEFKRSIDKEPYQLSKVTLKGEKLKQEDAQAYLSNSVLNR